jgi:hypothetical protein
MNAARASLVDSASDHLCPRLILIAAVYLGFAVADGRRNVIAD